MQTTKIQIDLDVLTAIVSEAKLKRAHDSSLSNTISLTLIQQTDCYNGSDKIEAWIKSGYQDANGKRIL